MCEVSGRVRKSTYQLRKEGCEAHGTLDLVGGYYERQISKTEFVPVIIWFGPPIDPLTGEELDRGPRWQCIENGIEADPYEVWTYCCHRPITAEQYHEMRSHG